MVQCELIYELREHGGNTSSRCVCRTHGFELSTVLTHMTNQLCPMGKIEQLAENLTERINKLEEAVGFLQEHDTDR